MIHFIKRYSASITIILLIIINLIVFSHVATHEFINYDDIEYVTMNDHVKNGLTIDGLKWAFTSKIQGHYHPLTCISHMLDCQLFGMDSGLHHLSSLSIHILNSILLFIVLNLMSGLPIHSAIIAVLFSVHPIHVESVAMVSSRKDLLSGLFWMLAMLSYFYYVKNYLNNKKRIWYVLVFICFVFGLMSKSMVVTLPIILLIMDYYPLARLKGKNQFFKLCLEKIILFIPMVIFAVFVVFAMSNIQQLNFERILPLSSHMKNGVLFYAKYIGKILYPENLVMPYPFPDIPQTLQVSIVIVGIILITTIFYRKRQDYPYLIVGWAWYLITLLPMVGIIIPVPSSMADRYTYIPAIGIFIIIVFGIIDIFKNKRIISIILFGIIIIFLIYTARIQTEYYKNSFTLFERTIKLSYKNPIAHYCYGFTLETVNRLDEAEFQYKKALEYSGNFFVALNNLGIILIKQGKIDEAIPYLTKVVTLKPDSQSSQLNLANALLVSGKPEEAVPYFENALRLNPAKPPIVNDEMAHMNLAGIYLNMGEIDKSIEHFKGAVMINPTNTDAHYYLGLNLTAQNKFQEAIEHFKEVLKIKGNNLDAHIGIGYAYYMNGDTINMIYHYKEALKINPQLPDIHHNLGVVYLNLGDKDQAQLHLAKEMLIRKMGH